MKKNHNEVPARRLVLKTLAAGGGVVVAGKTLPQSWYKPVVETVVLPAHAQTSGCEATFIRAISPGTENNNRLRYVLIVDDSDDVLARCCCGGSDDIVVEVSSLPAGVYQIFGDSDGSLDHTVRITTECGTTTVSAPTTQGDCNFLMATVTLPDGLVVQESGQTVGGDKCGGPENCLEGNTN